jgi:hypothetical protein
MTTLPSVLSALLQASGHRHANAALQALKRTKAAGVASTQPVSLIEIIDTYRRRARLAQTAGKVEGNFDEALAELSATSVSEVVVHAFEVENRSIIVFADPSAAEVIAILRIQPIAAQ